MARCGLSAIDALLQPFQRQLNAIKPGGIGKTDIPLRPVKAKVSARRDRDIILFQQRPTKGKAVIGQVRSIGIDIERTLRHARNTEAQLPQPGHKPITTQRKRLPALLQYRDGIRLERGQRSML